MLRRRVLRFALIVLVLPAAWAPAAHAAPGDGWLGAPGAVGVNTVCPGGAAVTGVTGTTGAVSVSRVVATATVTCQGGAVGSPAMGTGGDEPGSTTCPAGQVAVGIVGREADYVDGLALRCQAATLSGPITDAVPYGGSGGEADGPYDCPSGQYLIGLGGAADVSGYVRAIFISNYCDYDSDRDGISNKFDNCPGVANPDQANSDSDPAGDACDPQYPADGRLGGPETRDSALTVCTGGKALSAVISRIRAGDIPVVQTARALCEDGAEVIGAIGREDSGSGATSSTSCAGGTVAVGIAGREGDLLDQLALRCRAADLTGPIVESTPLGGPGGAADGPYDCPAGQVLTGLYGSEQSDSSLLTHVETRCGVWDPDGDGVGNPADNCPKAWNAAQADADSDGTGDACDATDNRPLAPTATPTPSAAGRGATPSASPVAPTRMSTTAAARLQRLRSAFVLRSLSLRGLPAGATVSVRCKGTRRSCAFRSQRRTSPGGGALSLTSLFKGRRLAVATVITIKVTAPNHVTRTITYTLRKGRTPRPVTTDG